MIILMRLLGVICCKIQKTYIRVNFRKSSLIFI